MTSIIVPPMEEEDVEKFKAACLAIGETLNAEIKIEEVVSLKIWWQNNRGDVATVIGNLTEQKTKRKSFQGKSIKIGNLSEEYTDPKNL